MTISHKEYEKRLDKEWDEAINSGYDQFLDAVTFDYVDGLETVEYDQELEVPKYMRV